MRPTAGVSFKPQYFEEAIACPVEGLWFEIHAENYMVPGGPRLAMLAAARSLTPVAVHGVGLSLAGADRPDREHLARLRQLIDRFEPFVVSEHLAWSRHKEICFPDLLPFPRTGEALRTIARNVDIAQEAFGRTLAIENPSLYIELGGHDWGEAEFLSELVLRTGCDLLVDVNNVQVSATNLGFDADAYLDALPAAAITEIHLAGHSADPELGASLLVDSHDAPVAEPVWALHRRLVERTGPKPTLIERDGNLPPFAELLEERNRAAAVLLSAEREYA